MTLYRRSIGTLDQDLKVKVWTSIGLGIMVHRDICTYRSTRQLLLIQRINLVRRRNQSESVTTGFQVASAREAKTTIDFCILVKLVELKSLASIVKIRARRSTLVN